MMTVFTHQKTYQGNFVIVDHVVIPHENLP